jgi:hypothetical protein
VSATLQQEAESAPALLFNLLPALRRRERSLRPTFDPNRRADSTYFQTSPRTDDPHGFFARGYEPFLRWARQSRAPLLHLTGLSGSGKLSLLSAYLKPQLEASTGEGRSIVVILGSYRDRLEALKEALKPLWEKLRPTSTHSRRSKPCSAPHASSSGRTDC